MDCTVSRTGYMYFGFLMKRNSTWGKLQDNVIQPEKKISEKRELWGQGKQILYLFIYLFINIIGDELLLNFGAKFQR